MEPLSEKNNQLREKLTRENRKYYENLLLYLRIKGKDELVTEAVLTFLWLTAIVCLRFMICYLIIEVFYNTIGIISSMVNFMSVKIGRK